MVYSSTPHQLNIAQRHKSVFQHLQAQTQFSYLCQLGNFKEMFIIICIAWSFLIPCRCPNTQYLCWHLLFSVCGWPLAWQLFLSFSPSHWITLEVPVLLNPRNAALRWNCLRRALVWRNGQWAIESKELKCFTSLCAPFKEHHMIV